MKHRHRNAGFTLVEVLVALFAMALLAALSWQGLDGVLRSRDASREAINDAVRLSTVLTQWEQDLLAVHDSAAVPALEFDGQSLRLTRRTDGGVQLVVWAVRPGAEGGVWQRWASRAFNNVDELQDAWMRSQQFLGNEAGQLQVATGASDWQIYFHRSGSWTNAQSTGNLVKPSLPATPPPLAASAPDGPASGAEEGAEAADAAASAAGTAAGNPSGAPAQAPPAFLPPQEQLPAAVRLVITLGGKKLTRDIALGPSES